MQTGGSRSTGTRVYVDLRQYANDADYEAIHWSAARLDGRPFAIWRPAPPYSAGLSITMRHSLIGQSPRRWFAQSMPALAGPRGNDIEKMIDIAQVDGQVSASSVKKVGEIVQRHPEEAVSIMRHWLHESA